MKRILAMLEYFAVGAAVCLLVLSLPLAGASGGEPVDLSSREMARFAGTEARLEESEGVCP